MTLLDTNRIPPCRAQKRLLPALTHPYIQTRTYDRPNLPLPMLRPPTSLLSFTHTLHASELIGYRGHIIDRYLASFGAVVLYVSVSVVFLPTAFVFHSSYDTFASTFALWLYIKRSVLLIPLPLSNGSLITSIINRL